MDDSNAIVLLVAVWLASRALEPARAVKRAVKRAGARVKEAEEALQRGGAAVYDRVHDDAAHKRDLPGKQLTRQALLDIASRAMFPDPKLAAAIALAESGGVTGAIARTSREFSVGLWQINIRAHRQFDSDQMRDPYSNALAAFAISKGGKDWSPWVSYKNGKYRQFQTGILAP